MVLAARPHDLEAKLLDWELWGEEFEGDTVDWISFNIMTQVAEFLGSW